jgi:hypothetical protein
MFQLDDATACEALFVSDLQSSQHPEPREVSAAITDIVRTVGRRCCAALVAQEFGDHPETAVARMRWVRKILEQPLRDPVGLPA